MAKRNFFEELEIKSKDEKLSEELEKQSTAHLASRSKMESEANGYDSEILKARDELNDAADCANREKMEAANERYKKAWRKKMALRDDYHKKSQEIRNEQVGLMQSYHEEVIILMDKEVGRAQKGHVFDMPLGRVTAVGNITESPYQIEYKTIGKKEPHEVEIRFARVVTNAFAITQYVELCQSCAGNIRKCLSLGALKEALGGLQAELTKINLEPVEVRISEEQIGSVNPGRINDVAFITKDAVSKLRRE